MVSGGGIPCLHCQCAFGDGEGSPPLLVSTVWFHICGVRSHPHGCGFSGSQGVLALPTLNSVDLWFLWWAVNLHVVLAPHFIVRWNSIITRIVVRTLSDPVSSRWLLRVPFCLLLFLRSFPGGKNTDLLALSSPRLLLMGEGNVVFWVSARLVVLSSLPALLVLSALLFQRGILWLVLFILSLCIIFYNYVFFPHFCTGLLLHGCYTWRLLQVCAVWSSNPLQTQFIWLGSYAIFWYWFQDNRHNVAWPCVPCPFNTLSPSG